jgi:hypothetical protein
MSFTQENGYQPVTFATVMDSIRTELNVQFGTSFTPESFIGSNWYKYFYTLVQRLTENETKTADIFFKLTQYIKSTNEAIQRPSVSLPGLLDSFASRGFVASVKKNLIGDAGTISIAVNTDSTLPSYAATKLQINSLIRDFVVAGLVYMGTEVNELTLSNGQQFDFKFFLPQVTEILLRLTLTPSDNLVVALPTDIQLRTALFNNINSRYRLGWDFEPQRYFTQVDAPWAAEILLEYSTNNGSNWFSDVYEATFRDLFTFSLEDITVVVNP